MLRRLFVIGFRKIELVVGGILVVCIWEFRGFELVIRNFLGRLSVFCGRFLVFLRCMNDVVFKFS